MKSILASAGDLESGSQETAKTILRFVGFAIVVVIALLILWGLLHLAKGMVQGAFEAPLLLLGVWLGIAGVVGLIAAASQPDLGFAVRVGAIVASILVLLWLALVTLHG